MIDISTFITFSNGYIKDADDDEAYDDFRGLHTISLLTHSPTSFGIRTSKIAG